MRGLRTPAAPAAPASVYPSREDTELLRRFAAAGPGETVADVGTGGGSLAVRAALGGARVVATDLNPAALRALRTAARAAGVSVAPVRTDLLEGTRRFDRILANPPYLPTRPADRDPDPWAELALDGGPDGCRVHARLVRSLRRHLVPGGSAFLLESSRQSARRRASLRRSWRRAGGTVRRVGVRRLEGEVLSVWRWRAPKGTRRPSPGRRRTGRRPRGTAPRRRARRASRAGATPATGR